MAISAASAAFSLSSSSRRTPISSSATSLGSSSSLFFNDSTINRAGLGFLVKARTSIKYDDDKSRRRGLSCNCMFGLGVPELAVIAGVTVLLFGPKKLPEVGRSFGKTIKSFQQAAKEFESELRKEPEDVAQSTAEEVIAETEKEKQKTLAVAGEEKLDVTVSNPKES